MKKENNNHIAAASIIIFGGNGDLSWRKLFPAFYNLFIDGHLLNDFEIIGVHYGEIKEEEYKKHLLGGVNKFSRRGKAKTNEWKKFAEHLHFFKGDFTEPDTFKGLKQLLAVFDKKRKERGVRLFFYAVAPRFIEAISTLLNKFSLANDENNDRIVVEKPFGTDLITARQLNAMLTHYFSEKQLYRIDHYLGKEPVQNILTFRFANIVFEPIWNHNYIENIQVTVAEDIGIAGRGGFYEQAGALKDMVQNHLLQLLCVIAMEPPVSFNAEEIRNKKADVLKAIRQMTKKEVAENVVRGQYGEGRLKDKPQSAYRKEERVNPRSNTETFVAARFFIDNWRWQGVPFYLRTGKALQKSTSVIAIQFKKVPHAVFPPSATGFMEPNQLIISIQPQMEITLLFQAKEPGIQLKITPVEMDFTYMDSYKQAVPEAYETLLLDALRGDATLFMRVDQVEEAWSVITPIINAWKQDTKVNFPNYAPGSWGPAAAEKLIKKDNFEWILLPEQKIVKRKARKS
jgi:glucose-6-phosphate 1-dehydrogenase